MMPAIDYTERVEWLLWSYRKWAMHTPVSGDDIARARAAAK